MKMTKITVATGDAPAIITIGRTQTDPEATRIEIEPGERETYQIDEGWAITVEVERQPTQEPESRDPVTPITE